MSERDRGAALVERLRARAAHQRKHNGGGDGLTYYSNSDAVFDDEVAARLDALEAERDEAKRKLEQRIEHEALLKGRLIERAAQVVKQLAETQAALQNRHAQLALGVAENRIHALKETPDVE